MRVPTFVCLFCFLAINVTGCAREKGNAAVPKRPDPKEQVQAKAPEEKKTPPKEDESKLPPKKKESQLTRFRDLISLRLWFKDLGTAYNIILANGKPPQSKDDFKGQINPELMKLIDDGYVRFIYKVGPLQMPKGASNTIVAYEVHSDPNAQRLVLMGDGIMKEISNEEFKKTPKADDK